MQRLGPIVPDFSPVTPDELRDHMEQCPRCSGPFEEWCEKGRDLFHRFGDQYQREMERDDKGQAMDLIRAGWRFFPQPENDGIMSWYWRSPRKLMGGRLGGRHERPVPDSREHSL